MRGLHSHKKDIPPGLVRIDTYVCESYTLFNAIFVLHNTLRRDTGTRPRSLKTLRNFFLGILQETSRVTHRGPLAQSAVLPQVRRRPRAAASGSGRQRANAGESDVTDVPRDLGVHVTDEVTAEEVALLNG